MKNLKNNIEQTCIEFGKYVANNYAPQTPVDIIKGMWGHFQEQQAKEVMDILDDIQSNDKSDDLYTIDGLDDNGIGEPVCEDFNKHFASKQVEINREIIQSIKESSEMHDDIFMKIHNIIKLLHDRISDSTSLIKTVSNITSANEIALNHLEKAYEESNKDDRSEFPNGLESNDSQPVVKKNLTTDYPKLVEDYMDIYKEENILEQDYIEIPASDLTDFYESFGGRIKRWVKVAIERNNKLNK